jgi:cytochrome c553
MTSASGAWAFTLAMPPSEGVTGIGDSVMAGVALELQKATIRTLSAALSRATISAANRGEKTRRRLNPRK